MHKFFYPNSVVVVGVSNAPTNLGRIMLENLFTFGFPGKVFAVGKEAGRVNGVDVLPSVASLPEAVDLAAILTPAKTIPSVIAECGAKGIHRAVILSAGFTELSDERGELQRQLVETASRYGVRFVGPNCMGLMCTESRMAVPFSRLRQGEIETGSLSILAQSGSVAFLVAWHATYEGTGLAKFVSMGNKLNIDEVDLLPYFIEDPQTKTIAMYLEGITRGRELVRTARESSKPIVVLKANISDLSAGAAKSHTASLASDERVVDGALRQAGITRVHTVRDIVVAAKALGLPPLRGNRVVGVTTSGGGSVVGSDYCHRFGFRLPALPAELRSYITSRARAQVINLRNPLDLGDVFDNAVLLDVVERVVRLPEIDGIFVSFFHFYTHERPGPNTPQMIDQIAELMWRFNKPIALSLSAEPALAQQVKEQTDFPVFDDVEQSIGALHLLRERSRFAEIDHHTRPFPVDLHQARQHVARLRGPEVQSLAAGLDLLTTYGLDVAPWRLAASEDDAVEAAQQIGFPVALKAVARGVVHKSDVGGVLLDLPDAAAVRRGFGQLYENIGRRAPGADLSGMLVQSYIAGGVELILGAKRDEQFGPVVMFGVGGIFTEALGEVAFRLAPLSIQEAEALILQVRGARILEGVRGNEPAAVAALATAIARLGQLIADHPSIREIDLNPIKAFASGTVAVDARMVADV